MRNPLSKVYEFHIESSDSCNLHCDYCYFQTKKQHKTTFPLDRLRKLLNIFFSQTERKVNLVFHGGEPLMNSAEWLDEACEIAKEAARKHQNTVCFHLQTNGTLLTENHITVLEKNRFTVNVSLDGPEDIHNRARGQYSQTIKSIKRLQESGIFMGIITVIGKHNFDKIPQVVEHFIQLGVKRYHFNIGSILSPKTDLILSTEEISRYYDESLQTFLKTYQQSCNWVLLGKLRRYLSNNIPQFACDSPLCGAGIYKIHLLPNGDYYPCGSCVNTTQGIDNMRLGNLFQPLSYNDYQQKLLEFQAPYFAHRNKCEQCPAAVICDFLCPAFDSQDKQTLENRCRGSLLFFDYLSTIDRAIIQQVVSYYTGYHE